MQFLFLGLLVFAAVFWLLWAIVWAVVWAISLIIWPLALLVGAALLARGLLRRAFARPLTAPASPPRNSAFEEYREQTLRRLDEESCKFREFLERLRRSRDKQEFDRFMAGRRGDRPALPHLGA